MKSSRSMAGFQARHPVLELVLTLQTPTLHPAQRTSVRANSLHNVHHYKEVSVERADTSSLVPLSSRRGA